MNATFREPRPETCLHFARHHGIDALTDLTADELDDLESLMEKAPDIVARAYILGKKHAQVVRTAAFRRAAEAAARTSPIRGSLSVTEPDERSLKDTAKEKA